MTIMVDTETAGAIGPLRVTSTVREWLDGTGLFQEPDKDHGYGPGGDRLVATLNGSKTSARLRLQPDELEVLRELAETMANSAADDAGWEPMALGELNAARALIRNIDKAKRAVA